MDVPSLSLRKPHRATEPASGMFPRSARDDSAGTRSLKIGERQARPKPRRRQQAPNLHAAQASLRRQRPLGRPAPSAPDRMHVPARAGDDCLRASVASRLYEATAGGRAGGDAVPLLAGDHARAAADAAGGVEGISAPQAPRGHGRRVCCGRATCARVRVHALRPGGLVLPQRAHAHERLFRHGGMKRVEPCGIAVVQNGALAAAVQAVVTVKPQVVACLPPTPPRHEHAGGNGRRRFGHQLHPAVRRLDAHPVAVGHPVRRRRVRMHPNPRIRLMLTQVGHAREIAVVAPTAGMHVRKDQRVRIQQRGSFGNSLGRARIFGKRPQNPRLVRVRPALQKRVRALHLVLRKLREQPGSGGCEPRAAAFLRGARRRCRRAPRAAAPASRPIPQAARAGTRPCRRPRSRPRSPWPRPDAGRSPNQSTTPPAGRRSSG